MDRKKEVRASALAQRAALTKDERQGKDRRIQELVLSLPEYEAARTVMLFLNFRDEVETTFLAEETLARAKGLILPRCGPQHILIPAVIKDLSRDVEPGMWGIREPKKDALTEVDPETIDLVFVPGAAFDRSGNRLGYGGGYYDRFFARLPARVPRVAIAYSLQVLSEVPTDEHDEKMTMLITEEGVERF